MTHSVASSFSPGPVFLKCIPLSQLLEETSWKSSHYTAVIESWDCFWLKFSNYFSSRESDDFRNTLFFFIHLPMIFQLNKNFKQVRGLIKLENEFPRVGISVFAGDLLQYLNSNFFFLYLIPRFSLLSLTLDLSLDTTDNGLASSSLLSLQVYMEKIPLRFLFSKLNNPALQPSLCSSLAPWSSASL